MEVDISTSDRLQSEIPALTPMVARLMWLARALPCLALIAAVVVALRSAAYVYFHGDDRSLKAVVGLLGW